MLHCKKNWGFLCDIIDSMFVFLNVGITNILNANKQ